MKEQFNSGFSQRSYLSIIKSITEGIYNYSITAPSNKNTKFQTKGLLFNYINDDSINAYTFIENGYDNIVVNTGTIAKLYGYFFSVFSSNMMFKNVGDSSAEQGTDVQSKFDYDTMQILLTGMPNDKSRRLIAEYTSLFAIRYIIAHELGHMLNGHTYFINNLYGVPKIEMIFKSLVFNLSCGCFTDYALDRRTLEMDADAFAASIEIGNLTGILNKQSHFRDVLDCLESHLQIFELWTFAVHSFFMILELENPRDYSDKDFYLPNSARETLNLSAAINTLDAMISKGYFKCSSKEHDLIMQYFLYWNK